MSRPANGSLISRMFDGDDPAWAVAAKQAPAPTAPVPTSVNTAPSGRSGISKSNSFVPIEPTSFREAGLRPAQIEALILKFLLNSGGDTGREIAQQVALPFGIIEPLLQTMRLHQLIAYRGASIVGDYVYELAPAGAERARSHVLQSTYFGSAPVPLEDYVQSVEAQSIQHQRPRLGDVKRAFNSLVLGDKMLRKLGEAVNLGKGLFLHGDPGNGKTCIAEQITSIYSEGIWIPRAIQTGGEIVRVYDPIKHEALEFSNEALISDPRVDSRWVYIKRPTILVGGELQLSNLEITTNPATNISEAPIQLKANCGTLVIDDFGRQRFEVAQLLNRLIVPLERRIDSLNMPNGRSFKIPFDLMVIFSTNLSPESLVDEAFLRRVPFSIRAENPSQDQYREVFAQVAAGHGLTYEPDVLDYLLETYYRKANRELRFCHPRDILQQVANSCEFLESERVMTRESIDGAIENCLAIRVDHQSP